MILIFERIVYYIVIVIKNHHCIEYLSMATVYCQCGGGESCHQHCCDVLASAAGGAPPLSLSSHVRVHQTWIQHDPYVLSSKPPAESALSS